MREAEERKNSEASNMLVMEVKTMSAFLDRMLLNVIEVRSICEWIVVVCGTQLVVAGVMTFMVDVQSHCSAFGEKALQIHELMHLL